MGVRRARKGTGTFRYVTGQTLRAGATAASGAAALASPPGLQYINAGFAGRSAHSFIQARSRRKKSLSAAEMSQRKAAARAPRRRRGRGRR